MAKIAVTASVFFFFFFLSAQAFFPTDDFFRSDSWMLTDSDSDASSATILLPSEKPDGKIVDNLDWMADGDLSAINGGKLSEIEIKEPIKPELDPEIDGEQKLPAEPVKEESAPNVDPVLTVVTFRPIDRQFQRMQGSRRPFPLRLPRLPHRCRHRHFKPMGPRFIHPEIPYGNDMLIAGDDEASAAGDGGRVRHHPARWMKLHYRGPKMPKGQNVLSREDFKKTHPRLERDDMERVPFEKEEGRHGGGLFKGFRKFLNGF